MLEDHRLFEKEWTLLRFIETLIFALDISYSKNWEDVESNPTGLKHQTKQVQFPIIEEQRAKCI